MAARTKHTQVWAVVTAVDPKNKRPPHVNTRNTYSGGCIAMTCAAVRELQFLIGAPEGPR